MVHRVHDYCQIFYKSFLILFSRNDCGPVEMIKNNVCSSKHSKNMQLLPSAHRGMEDAQVGDRELHTTTDRNKGTRTATMTIQVGPGRLRAARIAWTENN